MMRRDLPLNCRRSETDNLPTVDCVDCGQAVPPTVGVPISLAADLDPICPVKWVCPTPLCHGPFER